MASLGNVASWI